MDGYGGGGGFFGGDNAMGGGNFGGSQGGGGGGFNNSQGGGGSGPVDRGNDRPNREAQSVIPLTVRMTRAAKPQQSDGKFMVDGVEIYQVRIMGFIRDLEEKSTRAQYTIEDSTGIIDATNFIDDSSESDADQEKRARLTQFTYVRIIGTLRSYQDTTSVMILSIQPVQDFNALTHHFLECIYVHLVNTKGPRNTGGAFTGGANNMGGGIIGGGGGMGGGMGGGSSAGMMNGGNGGSELDPRHQQVLDVFSRHQSDENGVHVQSVAAELKGDGFTFQQVQEIVQALSSEGQLYSTIDDNHFMTTGG